MSRRGRLAQLGLLLVSLVAAVACVPGHEMCAICEREIHPGTHASLVLKDGRTFKACCPRCALEFLRQQGAEAEKLLVSDHASGRPLPVESAFLVEGSDETPCLRHDAAVADAKSPLHLCYDRCRPSIIAFEEASAAAAFTQEHGGRLFPPGTHTLSDLVHEGAAAAP